MTTLEKCLIVQNENRVDTTMTSITIITLYPKMFIQQANLLGLVHILKPYAFKSVVCCTVLRCLVLFVAFSLFPYTKMSNFEEKSALA